MWGDEDKYVKINQRISFIKIALMFFFAVSAIFFAGAVCIVIVKLFLFEPFRNFKH